MAKLIVTTSWDDGSILDLKLAQMLTKYGLKGTFYIPKSPKNVTPLRKTDITALAAEHEIGAHTVNHPHLAQIPPAEAKTEIEDSKIYLEEILGKKIKMFSYPFGEYNEAVKTIIKDCGFIGARTVKPNQPGDIPDPYEFGITVFASNGRFHEMVKTSPELDWEPKAQKLFDGALENGGMWHIWGHSWDTDNHKEWDKLERVLKYIANKPGVQYATNGETIGILSGNR